MALIVIDVETSPSGMPSNRVSMSARLEIGHADPADLAFGLGRVRVVAHLGRQVEGDREAGLALLEQVAEALVGLLGGGEAGVLAHRPEAAAVHRRLDAAGERVLARAARGPRSSSRPARSAGGVEVVDLDAGRRRRTRSRRSGPRRGPCRGSSRASDRARPGARRSGGGSAGAARDARSRHSRTTRRSPISIVWPAPTATRVDRARRAGPGARSASSSPPRRGAAGRPRRRRPARPTTATIRPGMMARISSGPPAAAVARARGSPARGGAREPRPRPRARTASRRRRPRP